MGEKGEERRREAVREERKLKREVSFITTKDQTKIARLASSLTYGEPAV